MKASVRLEDRKQILLGQFSSMQDLPRRLPVSSGVRVNRFTLGLCPAWQELACGDWSDTFIQTGQSRVQRSGSDWLLDM